MTPGLEMVQLRGYKNFNILELNKGEDSLELHHTPRARKNKKRNTNEPGAGYSRNDAQQSNVSWVS